MSKALVLQEDGKIRIVVDGRAYGPTVTSREAKVISRWLNGGALADIERGGDLAGDWEPPKIGRVMSDVDRAVDSVVDLLKNGLK